MRWQDAADSRTWRFRSVLCRPHPYVRSRSGPRSRRRATTRSTPRGHASISSVRYFAVPADEMRRALRSEYLR